jgi:hypothetical protein
MTSDIHDFDFLAGEWTIRHRRLTTPGTDDWDEFDGAATVWSTLGGMVSIEELRIPARGLQGMGIRVFNLETRQWADHWVSGNVGVVNEAMFGGFSDGVGTFAADEVDGGEPIKARGIWDRITPTSCRWHQATSADNGVTWQPNWFMDWTRVA